MGVPFSKRSLDLSASLRRVKKASKNPKGSMDFGSPPSFQARSGTREFSRLFPTFQELWQSCASWPWMAAASSARRQI
jgi:hypothetical protein